MTSGCVAAVDGPGFTHSRERLCGGLLQRHIHCGDRRGGEKGTRKVPPRPLTSAAGAGQAPGHKTQQLLCNFTALSPMLQPCSRPPQFAFVAAILAEVILQ